MSLSCATIKCVIQMIRELSSRVIQSSIKFTLIIYIVNKNRLVYFWYKCYRRCCQSGDVVESPTSPAGDVGDYLVLYGFGSLSSL